MQSLTETDLIVVGGGPAGSAAAIVARSYGLSAALLERNSCPMQRPGEAAHPGVEPLLIRLGVMDAVQKAAFLRHEGHWVSWGGEPLGFVPFGRDEQGAWKGFQLWRPDFDAILLEGANRAGAMIVRPCGKLRPIIGRNGVVGVETPAGPWRCAFVIDATGRQRWLARSLKLEIQQCGPSRIAWFNYAEGECPFLDQRSPMIASSASGWTWMARVRPNIYQWLRVPLKEPRPPNGWCPAEFDGLQPMGERRGVDVSSTLINPAAGPGYFLAGEAASIVDPLSSHGVLKALMSGMKAAHYAASVLRYGVTPRAAASAYHLWLARWFQHDHSNLCDLYRVIGEATLP